MWEGMFHLVHATSLGTSEYRWSPKTCGHRRKKRVGGWWLVAPRAPWCGTQLASPGQREIFVESQEITLQWHFGAFLLCRSLLSASPSARLWAVILGVLTLGINHLLICYWFLCFFWIRSISKILAFGWRQQRVGGQRQCEAWSWIGRGAWKLWLHSVLDVGLLPGGFPNILCFVHACLIHLEVRFRLQWTLVNVKRSRDVQLIQQDIVHRCIPHICQGCDQEYNFKLNVKAAPWEAEAEETDVEVPVAGGVPVVFTIFKSKNIEKNERRKNATKQYTVVIKASFLVQLQLPPKASTTHRQHTEQSCRICFKRNGTKKHLQGMEFESLKKDSAMWPSAHSVHPDWPRVGGKRAEMVWLPLKKSDDAQWHHWYLMLGMTQESSYKVKMCQFPNGVGFCNGLAQEKESKDRRCLIPWIQE